MVTDFGRITIGYDWISMIFRDTKHMMELPTIYLRYIWEQTLHENAEYAKYAKPATFQKVLSRSDAASRKPSLLSTQSNAKFVSYKPI